MRTWLRAGQGARAGGGEGPGERPERRGERLNLRHVGIVFVKELIDTTRDRRTWMAMVVIPLLVMPLLMLVGPSSVQKQMEKYQQQKAAVGVFVQAGGVVTPQTAAPSLLAALKAGGGFDVRSVADPAADIMNGKVKAVIVVSPSFEEDLTAGRPTPISVNFDASDQNSSIVSDRVNGVVQSLGAAVAAARLSKRGLDPSLVTPFTVSTNNVAPKEKVGSTFMAMILPMLFGVWAALGGMYAAIDAAAGEKERGTLEPLLASPPSRLSLVMGKYLVVVATSVFAAFISLIGLYVAFKIKPEALSMTGDGGPATFALPWNIMGLMLLVAISLAAIFSALQLAVSVFARSFREAQTYLSPLTFLIVVPGIMTEFVPPSEVSASMFYIPVLNSLFVLKELIMGVVNWSHLGVTLGTGLIWTIVSLRLATSLFSRESVLFRT